ncbi:conserved exported hypothetical protein [Candidatus Zixiibacteriota bacterium]|nr:conserved exported hypothetical protein [candidate division Zixibacteria bacterium]
MKFSLALALLLVLAPGLPAQDIPDSVFERVGMEKLMGLMNLNLADLTFRDDYTAVDSFRLARVAELMRHPYGMIEFASEFKDNCSEPKPEPILSFAFENLRLEGTPPRELRLQNISEIPQEAGLNLFYRSLELNRLLRKARKYIYTAIPAAADSTFGRLSEAEKEFLLNEFKQNLVEDTADERRPVAESDSIQKKEENDIRRFVKFGRKIRMEFLLSAASEAAIDLFREINLLENEISSGAINPAAILSDTVDLPGKYKIPLLGKDSGWAIGGTGDDTYRGDYYFILDFGGNDYYDLTYNPENPHPIIIIDLSGNDIYAGRTDFTVGSGCMSAGFIFDMAGDDTYSGTSFSVGSGFFGLGMIYDQAGSDRYYGDTHVEGAGTFGLGLILDGSGADVYSGALYSQGFASVEGTGIIADYAGNDTYTAGNKYKDIIRYDDHFLSLSQGFAYGFRPYMSGGIGAIIDFRGNDTYISDIFGQGASYWWSLGLLYDSSGNDHYSSFQYAQGTGTHMTLGILLDEQGNDSYFGKGLMQGVGHDYSCGIMLDRHGNDVYHAYDLSQGAGSANGFGIQIDDRGDDAYYVMRKNNTQGFGDPRRDFGSIGLMLDLSGNDRYDGNGKEESIWQTPSKWGGGMNWNFITPDSTGGQ